MIEYVIVVCSKVYVHLYACANTVSRIEAYMHVNAYVNMFV